MAPIPRQGGEALNRVVNPSPPPGPNVDRPCRPHVALLLGGGALVIAAVVVLIGWAILQARAEAHRAAEVATANLTTILADNFTSSIREIDLGLLGIRDEIHRQQAGGGRDAAAINAAIARQDARNPALPGFRVIGPDGKLRYAVNGVANSRGDISQRDDFKFHRDTPDGGLMVGPPSFGPIAQQWTIALSRRITNPDGSFGGVVICSLPVRALEEMFATLDLGPGGAVGLYHTSLRMAARFPNPEGPRNPRVTGRISDQLRTAIESGGAIAQFDYTSAVDGVRRTATARKIQGQPYYILVGLAEVDTLAEWRHNSINLLLFGGLMAGLVMVAMLLLHRQACRSQDASAALADKTALLATSNAALHASATRLERILDTAAEGIYGIDADNRLTFANRATAELLGWPSVDALLGLTGEEAFSHVLSDGRPCTEGECSIRRTLTDGEIHRVGDEFFRRADGTLFPVEYVAAPHVLDGKVAGAVVIFGDVSPQRATQSRLQELNEQLEAARDKAEAASRAKGEFVANMSHEIRTPMSAIMGLARLLDDSPLADRERDYVAKIKLSAQSLLGILNDILDFSRIEAGRLELERTPFLLDDVLRSLSAVVSTNARDKGIETVFAVAPDVPLALVGDSLRLQQVLLNLTGNAVKFTDSGEVVLSIRKLAGDEDEVRLEFSIRDTGIGIPLDKQDGLFATFAQVDSSTSRRYGGSGLGLAISRRLVALMGGAITFTSRPGRGSDFRFTARFGRAAEGTFARPSGVSLEDLTVLVVDDNETAREVLAHTCRSFRWHAETAAGGTAALDLLRRFTADGRELDVLLLDWRMPGMDGVEMLRLAVADPAIRLPPVILMVTAFDSEDVSHAVADLPVNAILAKPTTPSSIFDTVARVRSGTPTSNAVPPPPLAGRLAGLRVLLVEDNEINQQVAREILLRAGARVDLAGDGREAVEFLRRGAGGVDAVLMDVQMPGMDGYQATRVIRGELRLATLPIIAMTANAMDGDREKSLQAGMDAHVTKPIDIDDLIATLAPHVPRTGTTAASVPAPAAPAPDRPDLPPHLPGIDLRTALIRLGGDRQMLFSLLGKFEQSQGGAAADTSRLLAQGNGDGAAQLLHRLRGVAANLGAVEVARLASEAEAAVKDGRVEAVPGLLADLDAAMAVVVRSARTLAPQGDPASAADTADGPMAVRRSPPPADRR